MRKHGWQLPYHPLQVVAVAVFLALGFAFYVFFAPFVGKQLFQYIVMGMYTPILICSFGLYIWCAGVDPADPGVFSSKKYLNIAKNKKLVKPNGAKNGREPTSSACNANGSATCEEANNNKGKLDVESRAHRAKETERKGMCYPPMFAFLPCASMCNSHEEPSRRKSEDGMFYCRLCEVEVSKYSKHCRVCDKCVDCFDHHCRWLNNCVGKRNYRKFFTLMVSALLLLIVQWSTGVLVLTLCFLEKTKFSTDIRSKLGSSFTIVPFVIVVAVCTILAMIATVPLAQLFFFHILLINKGISTYDYIIALREQEQVGAGGQQSPQMSPVSSVTGLSSSSSFNTFQRAAWCTPPPLFLEDQHDVVPPEHGSVSSLGKKITHDEPTKKKNPGPVKISPWLLARLNADDVSKAAAEARKKSKILQPVTDISFSSSRRMMGPGPNSNMNRGSRRILLPVDVPLDPLSRDHRLVIDKSSSLGPLHMEAPSDYRGPSAGGIGASSPESSSLDSLDIHPFRASSSGPEEEMRLVGLPVANQADVPLSRLTSDGYDASGGEDSDRVPTRTMINRSSALFGSEPDINVSTFVPPTSSMLSDRWKF